MRDKVVNIYVAKHGVDPSPLICADYMSNEASGPEDGVEEEEWVQKMGTAWHMDVTAMPKDELLSYKFYEVLEPEWRSEEVHLV